MFMNHEWIIMTSSNGIFSELLAFFAVHTPVTGEFPSQRPVTQNFDIFFDLRPNKRLRKEPWGQWFGAPSRSLWRYCYKNWSTEMNPKWSSYMIWAPNFQSLWPIDVIWRHTPLWTLVQVIIWTDIDRCRPIMTFVWAQFQHLITKMSLKIACLRSHSKCLWKWVEPRVTKANFMLVIRNS